MRNLATHYRYWGLGLAAVVLAAGVWLLMSGQSKMTQETGDMTAGAAGGLLSAEQADAMAARGEIVLVDIRRPEEWATTGIARHSIAITMHQRADGFFSAIEAAVGGDKEKPLAIICATGGRTGYLLPYLRQAGFTSVYDVSEGMMGSPAGPGWLRRGLPVKVAGQ